MAKKQIKTFVCQNCMAKSSKWVGRCSECQEWNTFEEEILIVSKHSQINANTGTSHAIKLSEIAAEKYDRRLSGIGEFDRVVGGGVVPGSLCLIGGEPGIGKSTLLSSVLGKLSLNNGNLKTLYVSGEESTSQVADRTNRLGVVNENFYILNETIWEKIKVEIDRIKPDFIVIDSIQTTVSSEIQSAPGTVGQIREVTYELMNLIKKSQATCFIVGHITKEGSIAGPKILEHMVDTVMYFEGDQHGHYRILRVMKNRFGNTNEVGIFEMKEEGLVEVPNPSQYFLDENLEDSFGRSLTCILEGSRSIFIEIQALVVENKYGNGRRTTQGIDSNRLSMLVAVIEKYMEIPLGFNDIYLNVVGGLKLMGRETDLSIIASLLSSFNGVPIASTIVFIGEVGLTGEVRSVPRVELRLKEMAQLNYSRVVTSWKTAKEYAGKFDIEIIGIKKASEIMNFVS